MRELVLETIVKDGEERELNGDDHIHIRMKSGNAIHMRIKDGNSTLKKCLT